MCLNKLILDVKSNYSKTRIEVPKNTVRPDFFELTFYYKKAPLDLTDSLVQVYMTKSNNDIIYIEAKIVNPKEGLATLPLTYQMTQSLGYIENFEFRIVSEKKKTIVIKGPKLVVKDLDDIG